RTYEQEKAFLSRVDDQKFRIKPGFVPNMKVSGYFYVNKKLEHLIFNELQQHATAAGHGGFLPAVKQIANVAALPGIVKGSIGLPDVHSGYGFAVGNVAAFDMNDPGAIVSPGKPTHHPSYPAPAFSGVGFDINCGVRLMRTNLMESDLEGVKEQLTQSMFDHI
ncbi:unnamed protein product, partial [Discosporangium mesarthrocarpum]